MAQGWKKIGNVWYYLEPGNGGMATGWRKSEVPGIDLNPGNGDMATGLDNHWRNPILHESGWSHGSRLAATGQ